MPEEQFNRAIRMVDFGLEEAEITFDLGPPVTDAEVEEMLQYLAALEEEST